jgi:hypothetical protein
MSLGRQLRPAALFASVLGFALLIPGATIRAQTVAAPAAQTDNQPPSDGGWHVAIIPYIWFSGVHGTTGVLGHDASVHASFGDIFNYFNIGVMGAVEVRYNRVIMPLDCMWTKLSDNKALPLNDVTASIKAKMAETLLTPKIGYRITDEKRLKVDALFGIRYWHLTNDLTLQPQVSNGFSASASWVDAVAGGRFEVGLEPKVSVMVLGDAGGGSARLDYQVAGLLGYKIGRKCVLLAGYRYLSVDYRPTGKAQFVYDVNMPGVVAGDQSEMRIAIISLGIVELDVSKEEGNESQDKS